MKNRAGYFKERYLNYISEDCAFQQIAWVDRLKAKEGDDDNATMVHISRIRNRIEDDPQNPRYLKTIRGIGYKLHYTGNEQIKKCK